MAQELPRSGLIMKAIGAIWSIASHAMESVTTTPVYFWIYMALVFYAIKKITYRHGIGSKQRLVAGKTVMVNSNEESIIQNVVDINSIDTDFSMVGGLEDVKQALTEHIIWPFKRPELFSGRTVRSHPKGVLLHGPPGTGKTLLARALAKELGCSFINVCMENIFSMWVGDTEKNAAAVFTLAEKISPCVIFVDEIDSMLSARSVHDASPHMHAKTIFMTHWDGLQKNSSARIIVVGATNRRLIIDDAIRRRMPLQLEVPTPDLKAREMILKIILEHDLEKNPLRDAIIRYVALNTANYTGSDLSEMCKAAALLPLREVPIGATQSDIPPLRIEHFDEALKRVKASTFSSSFNHSINAK